MSFPASVELSSLDGTNGFWINGANASDFTGYSVASAGDFNGDGFDDLIVGAPRADPNGSFSGGSYIVFGRASGFGSEINLATLEGSTGFRIDGMTAGDALGLSVASAGDVNGDGLYDLIVGAPGSDPDGASYLVFGREANVGSSLDLSTLDGANGFKLNGARPSERSGTSVSSAGDVNGDGFDDVIIGAPWDVPSGDYAGSSYVVFGQASGFAAAFELSSLNGSNGFRLDGVSRDYDGPFVAIFKGEVSRAGDINGDGFDDVIVGAPIPHYPGADGASYVVFGKASGFAAAIDLSYLNGNNGFRIGGDGALSYAGSHVATAGDINADGFDDIIVNAPLAGDDESATSFVVFGKATGFTDRIDLSSLNGTNGFRLSGAQALTDGRGKSVGSAGDVNGDGFDDLIVGAPYADGHRGGTYVVFGKGSGFAANLDLTALGEGEGFGIAGVSSGEMAGFAVAGAGDVNNDGIDDLIIGAPGSNGNTGTSYVVFGQASLPPIPRDSFRYPVGATEVVTEVAGDDDYHSVNDLGVEYAPGTQLFHLGEDWHFYDEDTEEGKPVLAIADGEVVYSQDNGLTRFGNTVVLKHDLGSEGIFYSLYAHLNAFRKQAGAPLKAGDLVIKGDEVGGLGKTGAAFGHVHLHFEIFSVAGSSQFSDYLTGGINGRWGYTANDAAFFAEDGVTITDEDSYTEGDFTWYNPSRFIDSHRGREISVPLSSSAGEVEGTQYTDTAVLRPGDTATSVTLAASGQNVVARYVEEDKNFLLKLFEEILYKGGAGIDRLTAGTFAGTTISQNTVYFEGDAGNDVLEGAATDRRIVADGGTGNDTLSSGSGHDTLNGGDDDDTLSGGAGNDLLRGGFGNDLLDGGDNVDTADFSDRTAPVSMVLSSVASAKVRIGGIDEDSVRNIENVTGGSGNDSFRGSDLVNVLAGGAGNDLLEGGNGNDRLVGNDGNDSLLGGRDDDLLIGGEGEDSLNGNSGIDTASYETATTGVVANIGIPALNTGDATGDTYTGVENLIGSNFNDTLATGGGSNVVSGLDGNDKLTGGGGDDTLDGGNGDDTLYGKSGVDAMIGGGGDDVYVVDNAGDVIVEGTNGGVDTVYTSANYGLGTGVEIEFFRALAGTTGLVLTGNALDNKVYGGSGADTLRGGDGADQLSGAGGGDILIGNAGVDQLTGGADADCFRFLEIADSGPGALRDIIMDFGTGADIVDLSMIDADILTVADQAFDFISTAGFSRIAGELRQFASGSSTILAGDVDGDGSADFQVRLLGTHVLNDMDFQL